MRRRLAALLMGFAACQAVAAPELVAIDPDTVAHGKAAEIDVTLDPVPPQGSLSLTPGGPRAAATRTLTESVHDMVVDKGRAYVAAGPGGLQIYDAASLTPLGQTGIGGDYRRVAVHGHTAYLVDGTAGLAVIDVEPQGEPRLIGTLVTPDEVVALAAGTDGLYLVLRDRTLLSVDNSDPRNLRVAARLDLAAPVRALTARAGYLFLAADGHGVIVVDVRDRTRPQRVGHYQTTGPARAIALEQTQAYVAMGDNGVVVLDVAEPAQPRWLSSHSHVGEALTVSADGVHAVIGNAAGEVIVLDTTVTEMPEYAGHFSTQSNIRATAVMDAAALVATNRGLERLDIRHAAPALSNEGLDIGRGVNFGGQRRLDIQGDIAYVADWFSGIHLYDISHPGAPRLLSSLHTPGSAKGIVVRHGYAYVGDDDHGLDIVDVRDPGRPRLIANLATPGLAYIPKLVGDLLYLASHRGGFQIIDVHDVEAPRMVSSVDTPGMAWSIEIKDDIAFVADDAAGLLIYDVSDPASPRYLGGFNPGGRAEDVVVRDGIAYVVFFDLGLVLLDITDPSEPALLGHLPTPGNARGITLHDHHAYVADWLAGLQIIDIANPSDPILVGSYDTRGAAWGVRLQHHYAYVADWWGGFVALDITDPQRPRLAGDYAQRGVVRDVATNGNYLFAAEGAGGLRIYDIENPLNPTWMTGVELQGDATCVALGRDYAYVGTQAGMLAVIDMANPYEARLVAQLALPAAPRRLVVEDHDVFGIDVDGSVFHIDTHRPAQPSVEQRLALQATDLSRDGQILYVTTADHALEIRAAADLTLLATTTVAEGLAALVRARDERAYLYIKERGIASYRRAGKDLEQIAFTTIDGDVTDMQLLGDTLIVQRSDVGLMGLDLTRAEAGLAASWRQPVMGPTTGFTAGDHALYLAGQSIVVALSPVAEFFTSLRNADGLKLRLSADIPLGYYDLVWHDGTGEDTAYPNVLGVEMPKPKKPAFTMEDLKRALEERRRQAPQRETDTAP